MDKTGQKVQIFLGSPLIQATYTIKTGKQTINSTYLVSIRCVRLAEGTRDVGSWKEKKEMPKIS